MPCATASASCVVVVNPEITSGHNNFELRDFHFIFGDACTALVLERSADAAGAGTVGGARHEAGHEVLEQHPQRLRLPELAPRSIERDAHELVFRQNGQMVFREVCPMVAEHITTHLDALGLDAADVRRFWLHQANLKMNQLIAKGVLGRLPDDDEAPVILDEYANTSSAGSVIAFHLPPRRSGRRRPRRDLLLRRRLLRRQRHRPPPVTTTLSHTPVCGSFRQGRVNGKLPQTGDPGGGAVGHWGHECPDRRAAPTAGDVLRRDP